MNRRLFSGLSGAGSSVLVLLLGLVVCVGAGAQSMVVVGEGGHSRECFQAAELAVAFHSAERSDIEVCSKALENINLSLSDRAATLVNRGILQLSSGQHEQARESYDAALALVDNQGETHVNIANMYVIQERYEDAVAVYNKGIPMMERRKHIGFLNRGLAYEYLKDYRSAKSDYERAIELAPEWVRAKKMLARVNLKLSGRH